MKNHHKFLCNAHGLVVNQFIWSLILILGYLGYENLWLNYLVECGSTNRIQVFQSLLGIRRPHSLSWAQNDYKLCNICEIILQYL